MLYVGQNILVAKKGRRIWHSSRVLDVDEKEVLVLFPALNGERMLLNDDDILEISFASEGARFLFESGYYKQIGDALVIERPCMIEKFELRRFPRVKVNIELTYGQIAGKKLDNFTGYGLIQDMSENSIRFSTDRMFSPDSYLTVQFSLPFEQKNYPVSVECRVVRLVVCDDDAEGGMKYQLGTEISRMDRDDQEKIKKFIQYKLTEMARNQG